MVFANFFSTKTIISYELAIYCVLAIIYVCVECEIFDKLKLHVKCINRSSFFFLFG